MLLIIKHMVLVVKIRLESDRGEPVKAEYKYTPLPQQKANRPQRLLILIILQTQVQSWSQINPNPLDRKADLPGLC